MCTPAPVLALAEGSTGADMDGASWRPVPDDDSIALAEGPRRLCEEGDRRLLPPRTGKNESSIVMGEAGAP